MSASIKNLLSVSILYFIHGTTLSFFMVFRIHLDRHRAPRVDFLILKDLIRTF